jgi:hypothetical protein
MKTDVSKWPFFPKNPELDKANQIADQVNILAAPMLPGCMARRYDFAIYNNYSPVDICFSDRGPVVPKLGLGYGKYYSLALPDIYYKSMLRDARKLGGIFPATGFGGADRLDSGPEKIAAMLAEVAAEYEFPAMLAEGTPERLIAKHSNQGDPWSSFFTAEYSAYLGRTQDAREMLQTSIKVAREHGRASLIAEAEEHLVKLDSGTLRDELIATMEYNWLHYKVLDTAGIASP